MSYGCMHRSFLSHLAVASLCFKWDYNAEFELRDFVGMYVAGGEI